MESARKIAEARGGRVVWIMESTTGWARINDLLDSRIQFVMANVLQLPLPPKAHRRKSEQWIREGKNAVKWTKLSYHDFVDNHVRLPRCSSGFALAYNSHTASRRGDLGNFLRRLVLPRSMKTWTKTTCETGGRRYARGLETRRRSRARVKWDGLNSPD